jgi:hypothetical protein
MIEILDGDVPSLLEKVSLIHLDKTNTTITDDLHRNHNSHSSTVTTSTTNSTSSNPSSSECSDEFDIDLVDNDEEDEHSSNVGTCIPVQDKAVDGTVTRDVTSLEDVTTTATPTTTFPIRRSILIHSIDESRLSRAHRIQRQSLRQTTQRNAPSDESHTEQTEDAKPQQRHLSEARSETETKETDVVELSVTFSIVTIRDYPRAMGDNPACTAGPSISIAWDYVSERSISIDKYETTRSPRRFGRELMIPSRHREDLLRAAGYSRTDIVKCIRDMNIARNQRRRTYDTLHLQPFQIMTESISRKAWNVFTLGEYKRKERATMQDFRRSI